MQVVNRSNEKPWKIVKLRGRSNEGTDQFDGKGYEVRKSGYDWF